MKILITGASGLVGRALKQSLIQEQHHVLTLSRQPAPGANALDWNPAQGRLNPAPLEGCEAVIHLAGETIACRWTGPVKTAIRESRVQGTRLLSQTLASLSNPPRIMISASAIGYYGAQRPEPVDEDAAPGKGFLAEVCQAWEEATLPASEAGIPVIRLRIGVVLSPDGGALAKMLPPFKAGLGGPVGDGKQHLSWITLPDLVRLIQHLLSSQDSRLHGPLNAVAPQPVTNTAFAQALGKALSRPALITTPAFALRLAFGEMARETVLADQQVFSRKLPESGFTFLHPDLNTALAALL